VHGCLPARGGRTKERNEAFQVEYGKSSMFQSGIFKEFFACPMDQSGEIKSLNSIQKFQSLEDLRTGIISHCIIAAK